MVRLPRRTPWVYLSPRSAASRKKCRSNQRLRLGVPLPRSLPKTQFIMLTIEEDSQRVFESLQAGASGYLVKNVAPERILQAVGELHAGGSPMSSQVARRVVQTFQQELPREITEASLSGRETEILLLLSKGYRAKEVADQLGISVHTVTTHVRNIYEKLHVRSRVEAVAKYLGK